MDKLSYLTLNLALLVLCALPLYCELKTEESPNFDLLEETDDVSESMRAKRGIHLINAYDDSSFKLRKPKQTQKEIKASKQKVGDSKTAKRKSDVQKPQSRDGKQRPLNAKSETQGDVKSTDTQKSGPRKNMKSIGNKKSQPIMDGRNSKDLKSVAKKREVGTKDKTVNELQKNTLQKMTLRLDSDNNQLEEDEKACVDKNGPVIIIDNTKDNDFKTASGPEQETPAKGKKKDIEEFVEEYNDEKDIKVITNRDKMKYTDGNKKYNNKNYKKPIPKEKPSSKQYITQMKKTKLSRKKD